MDMFIGYNGSIFKISNSLGFLMFNSGLFSPVVNGNMAIFKLSPEQVDSNFTLVRSSDAYHFVHFRPDGDKQHRITSMLRNALFE